MIEFKAWPKTPRLFRDMVITEKIDGTNGAIIIEKMHFHQHVKDGERVQMTLPGTKDTWRGILVRFGDGWDDCYVVGAQSRTRLITPEVDNHGFAKWVFDNAADLVHALGEGRHYGEWWGSGINRGYGLKDGQKKFSLFNVKRYQGLLGVFGQIDVVPTLYRGPFDLDEVKVWTKLLGRDGSFAAPGFMKPEGVVVFHEAAGQTFKVTLEGDEKPKGS